MVKKKRVLDKIPEVRYLSNPRGWNYPLLLIFVAGLAVRLIGTKPGFIPYHPDENMSYSTAIYMFFHHFRPNRFDYPAGVPLLHTLIYQTLILPAVLLRLFFPHPRVFLTAVRLGSQFLEEFKGVIFGHAGIKALFWSRYISATIGGLTIPLVYWLSKKLFNQRVGLFAAFFLAFNYRHVLGSHFGLPDVHNSFFSLLSLFTSALLLEKNTQQRYLLAGATSGLAFSIKYQPFSFLPFFLVHLIWAWRKKSSSYFFCFDFIRACSVAFLVFLIINPYFFFNLDEVIKRNRYTALRYGMGRKRLTLYPYFYLYHWGIGRLPSLAIILGMLTMLVVSAKKFLLIFSFVLPFFLMMTYYSDGGGYPRNFVTVIPFLMIFAGFFWEVIFRFLKKFGFLFLLIPILFYFNLQPIKNSMILSFSYGQPWTLDKLSQWLEKNIASNARIAAYPLYIDETALKKRNIEIIDWGYSEGAHSLAEWQEKGVDFAILNTHVFEGITYWWRQWPNKNFFHYQKVPFDYINSSFFGLTLREFLPYTIGEIYKPWQAANEYNYLIFKLPQKPEERGKRIAFFGFDDENQNWSVRSSFGFEPIKEDWDKGSLVIKGGSGESTSRLASPAITIKPARLYTVKGWLKNPGFLRIDFYQGRSEAELDKLGLAVALSPRAQVSDEWVQEEVSMVAPADAKYLTVSFQRQDTHQDFDSYLDKVEVFESDILAEEKFPELPYIQPTIPQESIYPNSFL